MKYSIVAFLLFLLSGCLSLTTAPDRLALLDQYRVDQEYRKAMDLIAEIPEEDPQALELEERRKLLLDELRLYEKQTIAKGLKQEQGNDWLGAKSTFTEALKKSGGSKAIEVAEKEMLLRFQKKMAALEHEELIVTGEWLQKKLSLLQSLYENDPGDLSNRWRYSRTKNDAHEIALQLLPLGEQLLEEKDVSMANRVIPLIVTLSPGAEANALLDRLNGQLQENSEKKQNDRKKIDRERDKKRMTLFNKAMAYNDLVAARRHLSKISPGMRKSLEVNLMRKHLQREINAYVQEELSIGDSFYRVGSYEQAITSWENIIELEPGNELVKSKIKRSAMIVEKLKVLRERQAE